MRLGGRRRRRRRRRVLGQRLAAAQHGHAPQLAHALAAEEALLVAQHGVRELVPRRAAAINRYCTRAPLAELYECLSLVISILANHQKSKDSKF